MKLTLYVCRGTFCGSSERRRRPPLQLLSAKQIDTLDWKQSRRHGSKNFNSSLYIYIYLVTYSAFKILVKSFLLQPAQRIFINAIGEQWLSQAPRTLGKLHPNFLGCLKVPRFFFASSSNSVVASSPAMSHLRVTSSSCRHRKSSPRTLLLASAY